MHGQIAWKISDLDPKVKLFVPQTQQNQQECKEDKKWIKIEGHQGKQRKESKDSKKPHRRINYCKGLQEEQIDNESIEDLANQNDKATSTNKNTELD